MKLFKNPLSKILGSESVVRKKSPLQVSDPDISLQSPTSSVRHSTTTTSLTRRPKQDLADHPPTQTWPHPKHRVRIHARLPLRRQRLRLEDTMLTGKEYSTFLESESGVHSALDTAAPKPIHRSVNQPSRQKWKVRAIVGNRVRVRRGRSFPRHAACRARICTSAPRPGPASRGRTRGVRNTVPALSPICY